ncbi:MAG: hypothetical protein KDN22_25680 [Verrucomicrobiae bacterium]|nr:hypothetical protein [Verrucomicrobiae bacterium]
MNRRFHTLIVVTVVAGLLAAPAKSDAGNFWDFLSDAWAAIQSRYFQNNQSSADALENEILSSAAQAGVPVANPQQYDDYAEKLAKTLAMLTPEQQARVFGTE